MKGVCLFLGLFISFQAYALNKMYLNNSGHITASIRWDTSQQPAKLRGNIKFKPDEKTLPPCRNIGFIQIEKKLTNKAISFIWSVESKQSDKNSIKTKNDYHIDYNASNCKKGVHCSPFHIDHNSNDCQYGRNTFSDRFDTCLRNEKTPEKNIKKIMYESCAVCRESKQVYSCIKWDSEISKDVGNTISIELIENPSDDFIESLSNFDKFYSN